MPPVLDHRGCSRSCWPPPREEVAAPPGVCARAPVHGRRTAEAHESCGTAPQRRGLGAGAAARRPCSAGRRRRAAAARLRSQARPLTFARTDGQRRSLRTPAAACSAAAAACCLLPLCCACASHHARRRAAEQRGEAQGGAAGFRSANRARKRAQRRSSDAASRERHGARSVQPQHQEGPTRRDASSFGLARALLLSLSHAADERERPRDSEGLTSPAATLQACRDRSQRLCPPSIGASWSAALLLPRQKPRQTAASAHASGRRCGRNGAASRRQPRRQAPRARFFGAPEPQRRAAR
jgi:hypothetical protein